jgi:hypothetical protein
MPQGRLLLPSGRISREKFSPPVSLVQLLRSGVCYDTKLINNVGVTEEPILGVSLAPTVLFACSQLLRKKKLGHKPSWESQQADLCSQQLAANVVATSAGSSGSGCGTA